jgi:hypothetical protein
MPTFISETGIVETPDWAQRGAARRTKAAKSDTKKIRAEKFMRYHPSINTNRIGVSKLTFHES